MKDEYYSLLRNHSINDNLSDIQELSYSQKTKMLERLLKDFNSDIVCVALNIYHQQYIKKNRVRLNIVYNTLKGICQRGLKK
jgi:hypothetical protein